MIEIMAINQKSKWRVCWRNPNRLRKYSCWSQVKRVAGSLGSMKWIYKYIYLHLSEPHIFNTAYWRLRCLSFFHSTLSPSISLFLTQTQLCRRFLLEMTVIMAISRNQFFDREAFFYFRYDSSTFRSRYATSTYAIIHKIQRTRLLASAV